MNSRHLPISILCACAVFLCLFTAPAVSQESGGPIVIIEEKWSMKWDRFKRRLFVDASIQNVSSNRLSGVRVALELFSDTGALVKTITWNKPRISPSSRASMKMRDAGVAPFNRYRITITGRAGREDFNQLFEGTYLPDKPGAIPTVPRETVRAIGMADVRVIGSREELIKVSKREEAMKISGTVQNLGDTPASNIEIVVNLMDDGKLVRQERCRISKETLEAGQSSSFTSILRRLPRYDKVVYKVKFKSVMSAAVNRKFEEVKPFDVEAPPLMLKNCVINPRNGLFKGTLINGGKKDVTGVVITIDIQKDGTKKLFKIQPGGTIGPGEKLLLTKATLPGYDGFSVNIEFGN